MTKFPKLSNSPSKLHVWETIRGKNFNNYHEHCLRCGSRWSPKGFDRAAFYCNPKPEWLKEHPDDDMEEF